MKFLSEVKMKHYKHKTRNIIQIWVLFSLLFGETFEYQNANYVKYIVQIILLDIIITNDFNIIFNNIYIFNIAQLHYQLIFGFTIILSMLMCFS